ncbi:MAG: 50S ribosomal protein L29 [Flavobacteriales bacterium]|jgi:large subunit ribosomal protein L29|nr:50S ribosomal protein L29 [Flavobacteriales bacterium]MBT4345625.1 50S ribosomal protein L29 [Flavobacteriales bacterium]MDA7578219.1 50S ribosomal protein L29 [Flavobacteriales bacterium]MDG1426240.1 50S ribosomal protein L29 [Flavobacteriales bacterium]MDG1933271.1 50S ribosomal protein L29 [Flavobacteriales bacterium]|tara:strand:+ start:428 stop:622 length:195 start_codon:yes stop_codon:yes gene_type:complete
MKAQILTDMPIGELNDLLQSERDRLVKMKMSHAVSPLENPMQIKFARKTVARIMTELSRRNISK